MRDQFVFEKVLGIVSGTSSAGFKGTVTDSATGLPVVGAVFAILGNEKAALTDAAGWYSIAGLAADTYKVTVSATGYATQVFDQIVKVGTESNLNISMVLI